MRIPNPDGESHWFLQHVTGIRLDLTAMQYDQLPDYRKAVGCGFLTKSPSRAAIAMMDQMVWKEE